MAEVAVDEVTKVVLRLISVGTFLLVWKKPCVSVGLYQPDAVIALLNGAPAQLSYNVGNHSHTLPKAAYVYILNVIG